MSATAILVKALTKLLGVRVATRLPENKPDRFVLVSRIGGGADDWATRNPRFLIECFATSELAAEALGEQVWEAWPKLRADPAVMWASADHNLARYDDPDLTLCRFQFTASLQLKAPQ